MSAIDRESAAGGLRLAELLAALSLATDLGMGQPLEQALRTCLIALGLGERLRLRPDELSEIYYVALLRFVGCSADASETAAMAGGDDIGVRAAMAPVVGGSDLEFMIQVMPRFGAGGGLLRRTQLVMGMLMTGSERFREGVRAHCELGENLAQRLGLGPDVRAGLQAAFEQWDGRGMPNGLAGEQVPLSARVVFLARDVEVLARLGGAERAVTAVRRRRGAAYDPEVADAFTRDGRELLAAATSASPWDDVLQQEPQPHEWVAEARIDAVLEVFADFVDLKSPFAAGHSREVARLCAGAAQQDAVSLRRAGLLHDLGRAAVPNGIWDKPGRLSDGEWERVRLHAYYTERIVDRVPALKPLAPIVGMHHERLDGSGYHRRSSRAEIGAPARVLAAADAYQALTQPRAYRPALGPDAAARELEAMAKSGRLDAECVRHVLAAAGQPARRARAEWPAGLTDREVEVLRLICRGGTKKQVAALLSISPSTADHHLRHIYEKAGVQTRAGATLFALEHDLLK